MQQSFKCLPVVITARKRSLGQGNVFTPVCHYVHRGGGLPNLPGCSPSGLGRPPWMQTLRDWADHPPDADFPPWMQISPWMQIPLGLDRPPQMQSLPDADPPPLGRADSPWMQTPPDADPPGLSRPPWMQTPPDTDSLRLGRPPHPPPDMVNKRAVRILLECILDWLKILYSRLWWFTRHTLL